MELKQKSFCIFKSEFTVKGLIAYAIKSFLNKIFPTLEPNYVNPHLTMSEAPVLLKVN